jgi:hypothetical protein
VDSSIWVEVALLLGLEHGGSPVTRWSAKDLFAFESSAFRSPSAASASRWNVSNNQPWHQKGSWFNPLFSWPGASKQGMQKIGRKSVEQLVAEVLLAVRGQAQRTCITKSQKKQKECATVPPDLEKQVFHQAWIE